jgi:hypothetical protein
VLNEFFEQRANIEYFITELEKLAILFFWLYAELVSLRPCSRRKGIVQIPHEAVAFC